MSTNSSNRMVIEWAPFEMAQGGDEATLLAASEALQTEFLSKQRGFIRRDLVKLADNQWADIVYWNSLQEAEQAAQDIVNSPVCHRYFELMVAADPNDPSAGVAHYEVIKTYQ